ncbi:hypothetical protein IGI04_029811 [Brassica rapa subsp. trilocularis]|uniref:Uncharacterized protein n=1 Tax=Brassica rapa subsp. trilocularis TaxID=1813537 RepID=A0ABQ7LRM2_BRACM|nr:hypothetical protein IGI04_029811 [Brassica rapa subsp. trilocularis]
MMLKQDTFGSTTGRPEIGRKIFRYYEIFRRSQKLGHQNGRIKIFGIDRGTKIHRKGRNRPNRPRSSRWLDVYVFRTWWQALDSVCVKGSRRCCSTCNMYIQVDMWSTRWNGQARGVAMHATEACGQPCVRWGVDLHALQSCSRPSGRGCVILHETEACSQPCGARGGTAKHEVSRCMRPDHAARHVEDVVSACMTSGARGAATHASGAMRSDTRAATRLVPDWLMIPINRPRTPLISTHPEHIKTTSKHKEKAKKERSSFDISTWRRFCSSEERSVLVETSSSEDQSRRGSTCEGRERVRITEVGFGVKATVTSSELVESAGG